MNSRIDQATPEDPLTCQFIGEAMGVHSDLGPGLDEAFYHQLLAQRLTRAGLACESKARGSLLHRGKNADEFECDLLANREVVAELKVLAPEAAFAPEHLAQILCYLKFWKARRGLLFDFGKERLIHRRVVFSEREVPVPDADELVAGVPDSVKDRPLALAILRSLTGILQAHGLGYRDTTYRGLIAADFAVEGIAFVDQPTARVRSYDGLLGEARCHCLVVAKQAVLLVRALRDRIATTDRAIVQTYLKHLDLPWGMVVNFGKTRFETLFVGALSRGAGAASPHLRASPNLRGN
jgi:GxxExxY protein